MIPQSKWCSSQRLPPYVWVVYASLPDLQEITPSSQHGTSTAQAQHNIHSLVNMSHALSPLPTAYHLDRAAHRSREQPPSERLGCASPSCCSSTNFVNRDSDSPS